MNDDLIEQMQEDAENISRDTSTLSELGLAALQLDMEIAALDAQAKAKKRELTKYMEKLIPEAMHEQSLPEFGFETPDGDRARITVGVKVVGTLRNAPDQDAAVSYLEESGFEGGVKTTLSIDYTEEEREAAFKMMDSVEHMSGKHPQLDRVIHPSTLAAFAREKIADDPTWDYTIVGLTALTTAKFTRRK